MNETIQPWKKERGRKKRCSLKIERERKREREKNWKKKDNLKKQNEPYKATWCVICAAFYWKSVLTAVTKSLQMRFWKLHKGGTNRWTDRWTDGLRTFFRDARTHFKDKEVNADRWKHQAENIIHDLIYSVQDGWGNDAKFHSSTSNMLFLGSLFFVIVML